MESPIAVFLMRQLACEQLPTMCGGAFRCGVTTWPYDVPPTPVHAYDDLLVSLAEKAGCADCIAQGLGSRPSAGHTLSAFWL